MDKKWWDKKLEEYKEISATKNETTEQFIDRKFIFVINLIEEVIQKMSGKNTKRT